MVPVPGTWYDTTTVQQQQPQTAVVLLLILVSIVVVIVIVIVIVIVVIVVVAVVVVIVVVIVVVVLKVTHRHNTTQSVCVCTAVHRACYKPSPSLLAGKPFNTEYFHPLPVWLRSCSSSRLPLENIKMARFSHKIFHQRNINNSFG